MPSQSQDHPGVAQLMELIQADDASQIRHLFDSQPELKVSINEPIGPFDSPALTRRGAAR